MLKAGNTISKLREAEKEPGILYNKEDINNVIRALVATDESEINACFKLFATDDVVSSDRFRTVVPLLGEDVTDLEIDALFEEVN